jgi:hypothetical protein
MVEEIPANYQRLSGSGDEELRSREKEIPDKLPNCVAVKRKFPPNGLTE